MRMPMRNAHATYALLLLVAACLPAVTNSAFGLSETIGQLFGAATKSPQTDAHAVTLDEMRRLRCVGVCVFGVHASLYVRIKQIVSVSGRDSDRVCF